MFDRKLCACQQDAVAFARCLFAVDAQLFKCQQDAAAFTQFRHSINETLSLS